MGRIILYNLFQLLILLFVGIAAGLFLAVLAAYLSQYIGWFGVLMLYFIVAGTVLLLNKRSKL